jgi:hypothetical protein
MEQVPVEAVQAQAAETEAVSVREQEAAQGRVQAPAQAEVTEAVSAQETEAAQATEMQCVRKILRFCWLHQSLYIPSVFAEKAQRAVFICGLS